jgi:hypothetical protein
MGRCHTKIEFPGLNITGLQAANEVKKRKAPFMGLSIIAGNQI